MLWYSPHTSAGSNCQATVLFSFSPTTTDVTELLLGSLETRPCWKWPSSSDKRRWGAHELWLFTGWLWEQQRCAPHPYRERYVLSAHLHRSRYVTRKHQENFFIFVTFCPNAIKTSIVVLFFESYLQKMIQFTLKRSLSVPGSLLHITLKKLKWRWEVELLLNKLTADVSTVVWRAINYTVKCCYYCSVLVPIFTCTCDTNFMSSALLNNNQQFSLFSSSEHQRVAKWTLNKSFRGVRFNVPWPSGVCSVHVSQ